MARKNTFMLVSLQENKAKKLAQVISNESCRKILDYLAEKEDATESQISKDLNIPISTVHYNLSALQKGGLVEAEEFHYSEKGKEVNHYKLANKYIIIAPKTTYGIKEKLRGVLPAVTIVGAIALAMQFLGGKTFGAQKLAAPVMERADMAMEEAAPLAGEALSKAAPVAEEAVLESAPIVADTVASQPNIALWFFIGAISVIALYAIISLVREKIKNK